MPTAVVEAIANGSKAFGKVSETNGVAACPVDLQRLWSSVAVSINTSIQDSAAAARALNKIRGQDTLTDLDTIPLWGRDKLDRVSYKKMHHYLVKVNFPSLLG